MLVFASPFGLELRAERPVGLDDRNKAKISLRKGLTFVYYFDSLFPA